MSNYINPRSFNREIKGYKDKEFKLAMQLNNFATQIKHLWLKARLLRVVRGRHWAIGKDYCFHLSGKIY